MEVKNLDRTNVLLAAIASTAFLASLFFLPWFSVTDAATRRADDWVCGVGELQCTGFETFPILRWLLILGAISPVFLAWILLRGHKLSYPPGEITMIAALTMVALIAYNGIVDRPTGTFDVGLDYGYWVALVSALAIAVVGFRRSQISAGHRARKAPGTV